MTTSGPKQRVTVETVRKAIRGVDIQNDSELLASCKGKIPDECSNAIRIIQDSPEEFEKLFWQRLQNYPLTKQFCSNLIHPRLKQSKQLSILLFPIVSIIFDPNPDLEKRLQRIKSIPGVKSLQKEYRGSRKPAITDRKTLDFLAEILVLDFLIELRFSDIVKPSERKHKPHPDIVACKDGKSYTIEVTRKQEIQGWETLEFGNLTNCCSSENHEKIRKLLLKALATKNEQFSRALAANTVDRTTVKVVAIKSSDFGFARCVDQATHIAQELLSDNSADCVVDCVWIVPDIVLRDSRWVCSEASYCVALRPDES